MKYLRTIVCLSMCLIWGCRSSLADSPDVIQPLHIAGENFVDAQGVPVHLWGVNIVAFYPSHELADKVAANLADRQINLVRPHHMLRPSSGWNPNSHIDALSLYKDNSRDPDPQAWDRFDYFNAALRKHGIYLMFAGWWTRYYQPGDVDILQTNDEDRKAWMDAVDELNGWNWRKAFDPRKMLAVIDDRAAALNEEFIRHLLTHVNPYTHLSYADDPQVLTFELLNECSSEYIILCGNRFPEYFQNKLEKKWRDYTKEAGIDPGDLYHPTGKAVEVRAKFLRQLDADYLRRMKTVIRETGSKVAIEFSNLWEGENAQANYAAHNDFIEDHIYADPMVADSKTDFIYKLSKAQIAGKPFIVGELNQSENGRLMKTESPVRTTMPLAAAAYGALQNWSGIMFFAWSHGDQAVGSDGWATSESRDVNLGNMVADGMLLDQLRTCGMIFRRGLLDRSTKPITIHVDEPYWTNNYHTLMQGKYVLRPGWQDVHEVRKTYGPAPADQAGAPWLAQEPNNPLVADTQQIIKDVDRKQLTIIAPQVEAFSGWMDDNAPVGLKHLRIAGEGFATVVVVADDHTPLSGSKHLVISRTHIDKDNAEIEGPVIRLQSMQSPNTDQQWICTITRPRDAHNTTYPIIPSAGTLTLPAGNWHECELLLKPKALEAKP